MSLREKINQQFNAAMKDKNKTLVSTLRLILAAINDRDIANRGNGKKEEVKDKLDDVAAGDESNVDLSQAMAAYTAAISKTKDIKIS